MNSANMNVAMEAPEQASVEAGALEKVRQAERQNFVFFAALAVVTLLPLLTLPLLATLPPIFGEGEQSFNSIPFIGWAIFFGGVGHVASTLLFFADQKAHAIMRTRKLRFYALPAVAIFGCIGVVVFNEQITTPKTFFISMFFLHLCWLHYHYQKQNYGLVSLGSASSGQRLPPQFLPIIMLPALAGGLAIIPELLTSVVKTETVLTHYVDQLRLVAKVVYGVALGALVTLIAKNLQVFKQPLVALFTACSFLFFFPAITIADTEFAFWSYALTHGFQYLLMLGFVAGSSRKPLTLLLVFAIAAGGGAALLSRLHGSDALILCGVVLTWVHFILDAKLWKMSDPEPRIYLKDRFSFIFSRR